jgi:hypothetical protein
MDIMDKDEKKRLSKLYKQKRQEEFIDSMPFGLEILRGLFDYLDTEMREPYDNTFRYTMKYLEGKDIDIEKVVAWLNDNGAYCDCEVFNVDDKI